MSLKEIQELLDLRFKGKPALLAAELDMSEAGVKKWFERGNGPRGAPSILMRMWLDEARQQPARAS